MIDFPASPVLNQIFTVAGNSWKWDGTKWVAIGITASYLPLLGGTMQGPIVLAADPVAPLQPATKEYVDNNISSLGLPIGDNRIINGDMRIDQRNNGASGVVSGYTVDRWGVLSTQTAKITWQRLTGGPAAITAGLNYSLMLTTTAAYNPLATDAFYVQQPVEADFVNDFCWGTSGAQPVTLSFWISVNGLTGTFSGSIRNGPAPSTRSYPFIFTVPTAGVWQKVVINIPGDSAGTWIMSGNAAAFMLVFDLGSGTNYRGQAGVWATANYLGAVGTVSPVTVPNCQVFISNVKLEIGNVATPFNKYSLAKCISDCQRYYQYGQLIDGGACTAGAQAIYWSSLLPTIMRASPTIAPGTSNLSNCAFGSSGAYGPYTIWMQVTASAAGSYSAVIPFTANAEL
jgi:hypothetical protein